jgi:hypothetical protein
MFICFNWGWCRNLMFPGAALRLGQPCRRPYETRNKECHWSVELCACRNMWDVTKLNVTFLSGSSDPHWHESRRVVLSYQFRIAAQQRLLWTWFCGLLQTLRVSATTVGLV